MAKMSKDIKKNLVILVLGMVVVIGAVLIFTQPALFGLGVAVIAPSEASISKIYFTNDTEGESGRNMWVNYTDDNIAMLRNTTTSERSFKAPLIIEFDGNVGGLEVDCEIGSSSVVKKYIELDEITLYNSEDCEDEITAFSPDIEDGEVNYAFPSTTLASLSDACLIFEFDQIDIGTVVSPLENFMDCEISVIARGPYTVDSDEDEETAEFYLGSE